MTIFDALTLIGGLCLFLFGMNVMGMALERTAGNKLHTILGRLTTNKFVGIFTGMGVTSVIQSSSATTVMVVGFVNSGLMTLKQAINVIMGANIGTTVTSWILSLGGISSSNTFVKLLKPTSFTPILALIGIVMYLFCKSSKKKDVGTVLLGFAVLMFGMDTMTDAVSGLAGIPAFQNMFLLFKNPILGLLVGAILTAVIQSSSASVGILQALAMTGAVSYGAAIPIIMGQNIGTCVTAILSSFGTNRNAKRAALVHLSFNVIGSTVFLGVFAIIKATLHPAILDDPATLPGIAVAHSAFNILCTMLLLPMSSLLEKLAYRLVPETKKPDVIAELDERLLATPSIALERCRTLAFDMANEAVSSMKLSLSCLKEYSEAYAEEIKEKEEHSDHYEDIIGTYLVKLSKNQINEQDSTEAAKLLKIIGDLERISDHSMNILKSAEEIKSKDIAFSKNAVKELENLTAALNETLDFTSRAFVDNDIAAANCVEPLEQIIDNLKSAMRNAHITRVQQGNCSIETGFVWSDIITNIERVSDHCSNIAACVLDTQNNDLSLHESLRIIKSDSSDFKAKYLDFANKYITE